jgi:hypothetical protein
MIYKKATLFELIKAFVHNFIQVCLFVNRITILLLNENEALFIYLYLHNFIFLMKNISNIVVKLKRKT